jgi:hypothetical protein
VVVPADLVHGLTILTATTMEGVAERDAGQMFPCHHAVRVLHLEGCWPLATIADTRSPDHCGLEIAVSILFTTVALWSAWRCCQRLLGVAAWLSGAVAYLWLAAVVLT